MKYNISKAKYCHALPFLIPVIFALIPLYSIAQGMRMEKGEVATCVIKVNAMEAKGKLQGPAGLVKIHEVSPNRLGLFKQVANIKPSEAVLLEISYPYAKVGEKVVVTVLDGGKLDNGKKVKLMSLDNQRKSAFGFSVSDDAGLYRLLVRKGNDTKIIRLWVGKDLSL